MYFIMHCFSPPGDPHALFSYDFDDPLRSWVLAERFEEPPPEPLRAEVEKPGSLPEFTDDGIPLMTKRMLRALREAGVHNLDTYAAEIVDRLENITYRNYVAFNIIGKIAAADLGKSSYDPSIPWFDSVVINEPGTRGALMFRLAESVNAIMVHEKVKQHLEGAGIDTLTFIPPEQWAG